MQSGILVALIGPQGSGKEYTTKAVQSHCGQDRVGVYSTGERVRAIARDLGLPDPEKRPTCEKVVGTLVRHLHPSVLAWALELNMREDVRLVLVYDCIRRPEDWVMVQGMRNVRQVMTVYLDRSREDRFEALQKRARADEGDLTWDEFMRREEFPQEQHIRAFGQEADVRITCRGGPVELDAQKAEFCWNHLAPYSK